MKPRDFFPTMPDEVFYDWLDPIIKVKGWPFKSIDDDLLITNYLYILGLDHSLRDWATCEWELRDIFIPSERFDQISMRTIYSIIGNCIHGQVTMTTNVENTNERFRTCTAFFKKHGNIPSPVVLSDTGNGLRIWDGNHRLAAVFHANPPIDIEIKAWVATFT